MKRIICLWFLAAFLWGCSPADDSSLVALRKGLPGGCRFDADITADYGNETYSFSMSCEIDIHGNLSFTVTAPQTIAGITGRILGQKGELEFDGTILAFSPVAGGLISPAAAPWLMVDMVKKGLVEAVDAKLLRLRQEPYVLEFYLDPAGKPIRGEILWNGRRILTVEVGSFAFL